MDNPNCKKCRRAMRFHSQMWRQAKWMQTRYNEDFSDVAAHALKMAKMFRDVCGCTFTLVAGSK